VLGDYILKKRCLPMRAVDQPEPLIAPPPRIHAGLFGQIAGAFRVAVVSLGREELLDGVLSEMAPLAPIVLQTPAPGASGYPLALDTLHEASGETVPVSTLAMFDRVVLLIDIPVETAAELAPNIIAPFVECIGSHLLLVDDRGGLCQVDDAFLADWRLAGPRGSASDYEHFWRAQRCRRP